MPRQRERERLLLGTRFEGRDLFIIIRISYFRE